tara:strand:+ start:89149 stop:89685 length:537 start_codon:yes stop_codon:yes gene_type:complete
LTSLAVHGQTETTDAESLTTLTDSLLKREISLFTTTGASLKNTDSLLKTTLTEISITHCIDSVVDLSWSTATSSVSTFIHIYFTPSKSLDSIFLVTHSHLWVKFPKDAYKGISQSHSCNYSGGGKQDKFFSPNYKAFYSKDKKRLYIYMQGGTDTNKYEVTWIIVNDIYLKRIVDRIP